MTRKIGILGGGLSGLTLGSLLKTDFEILEKGDECGGLCRTLSENGFTFDMGGSHIIFSKDQEALRFMLDTLAGNIVKNKRNTKILYNGYYVKYPFENGLADLPKEETYECLSQFIEILVARAKGIAPLPQNLKDWCSYTFGKGIAEKYLIPYNEKIWKSKAELLSLDWVDGRVPEPPTQDIVKSALGIKTEGYTHQLWFYYPKHGGIQSLIKAIESPIEGHITRDFTVKQIKRRGNNWLVSAGKGEREYDSLVSTMPIFDLIRALPDVPPAVAVAARGLKYNSLVAVMLGFNQASISEFSWVYLPDRNTRIHRVSFSSNFSKNVAPENQSSLLAEITCSEEDAIWRMDEPAIVELAVKELHKQGLIDKSNLCFSRVSKNKYAYIIYDLQYQKNIAIIRDYLASLPITLLGRFSEYKYLNMDACIRNAMNLADRLN